MSQEARETLQVVTSPLWDSTHNEREAVFLQDEALDGFLDHEIEGYRQRKKAADSNEFGDLHVLEQNKGKNSFTSFLIIQNQETELRAAIAQFQAEIKRLHDVDIKLKDERYRAFAIATILHQLNERYGLQQSQAMNSNISLYTALYQPADELEGLINNVIERLSSFADIQEFCEVANSCDFESLAEVNTAFGYSAVTADSFKTSMNDVYKYTSQQTECLQHDYVADLRKSSDKLLNHAMLFTGVSLLL